MNAEILTFAVAATFAVVGALGVVLARNPVHSALLLVQTLFAVAVLFIAKEAYFLAAIQVIVYAGAIVILFLFVIMLVGVDRAEKLEVEPVGGLRPLAVVVGAAMFGAVVTVILSVKEATGSGIFPIDPDRTDIEQLGDRLFTDWVFAFQLTGLLLTIAVVGAVVLARRPRGDLQPIPDPAPVVMAMYEAEAALAAGDGVSGSSAGEAGDGVSGSSAGEAGDGVSGSSAGEAGDGVSGSSAGEAGDGVSGSSAGGGE